jgi:hypothetical protein
MDNVVEVGFDDHIKMLKTLPKEKLLVVQRIVCELLVKCTTPSHPGAAHVASDDEAK